MKTRGIVVLVLVSVLLLGCTTVQPIWDNVKEKSGKLAGKALLKVGELTAKGMSETSGKVSDATPFITIANVNRPRPLTSLEQQYMDEKGITPAEEASYVTMLWSRGMKLVTVDGSMTVNGNALNALGNGMHSVNMPIESGMTLEFVVDGAEEEPVSFTETYTGESIEILEPIAGATIDLAKGFDIKWTPGSDSTKRVKVSMFFTQIGLQNVLPILLLEDTGDYTVTPEMLGEGLGPSQKYLLGAGVVQLERISEEVRYLFSGDAIVTQVDLDAVPVTVSGEPVKPDGPVIPQITATEGDVTVTIAESIAKYNPIMGGVANLDDIEKIGLATFVFTGVTGGSWEKTSSSTVGNVTTTTTTTKRWGKDFGVPVLEELANHIADGLMAVSTIALGAEEVEKDAFVNTRPYQKMASLKPESDAVKFQVNARDLANLSSWRNIKIRVGGTTSWYYDMARKSDTDAFLECFIDAYRQEPTAGEWDDFVFDVTIGVSFRTFPYDTQLGGSLPVATAKFTSTKLAITETTTYAELLDALKIEDFLVAYATAWDQWAEAYKSI